MFEIEPRKRDVKRDALRIVAATPVVLAILYGFIVFFEGPIEMFYAISGLILILIFSIGVATMVSLRFVIDEENERVGLRLKKMWVSTIPMRSIVDVIYDVDTKGRTSLGAFGHPSTGRGLMISTDGFTERDIRSAFEMLSIISEKYGFNVKEKHGTESTTPRVPSASSPRSTVEGSEDMPASEGPSPYKVK